MLILRHFRKALILGILGVGIAVVIIHQALNNQNQTRTQNQRGNLYQTEIPNQSHSNFWRAKEYIVIKAVNEISNMERVVLPNQSTVILEPSSSVNCQFSGNGLFLLLIVTSSPGNMKTRDVIRTTFREMEPLWNERFIRMKARSDATNLKIDRPFQLFFFVGQSTKSGVLGEIREEWKLHGDLIVDNLLEDYLKLTVKTLRMLKWVLHNCAKAKYLVKVDDDVFMNMPKLFSFLLGQPNGYNPNLVAGHVHDMMLPNRDPTSKWFTPNSVWSGARLPRFVDRLCYLFGLRAAYAIFEESKNTPLIHLEDVFITGIIASERLKYELSDPGNILPWWNYDLSFWPSKMLLVHQVTPEQFRCLARDTGRDTNDSWISLCH